MTEHKKDQIIKDQRKIHLKDSNGTKYIFEIGNNGTKSIFLKYVSFVIILHWIALTFYNIMAISQANE